MSVVVFLGPSLPLADAHRILDATYRPPVAMGDVFAAVGEGARVLVLIDGVFERTPAVWHKEILFALSRGARVFGASSMGALRAAELAAFGMEGVGAVFEMFEQGVLEDDDEVAVAHASAEHGFRAASDAMVNIRSGLALARDRGIVSEASRAALERAAKARFYADRSWASLLDEGADGVSERELEALRAFVRAEKPDRKRDDAIAVLERVAALGDDVAPHIPSFSFEASYAWRRFVRDELLRRTCVGPCR